MKHKYLLLILLLTGLKSFSQTDSFLTSTCIGTTTNPQNRFYQPQVADFDGDTDKDIIVLDESGVYRLFTNDGSNNFTQTTTLSGLTWSSLISKDMDNDGDIDIVSSAGKIFINNGSAVFTELPGTFFTATGSIGAFRVADFNGDTKQDILWLNATSNSTTVNQIWFNNGTTGNASFVLGTEIQNLNGYTNLGSVAGDIDNDGDIDLVFCQQGGWNGRVFKNNGSGVFTNTQNLPTYTGEGFLADWDNDGDIDFLAYDYYNNWGLRLWKNDGTGTFGTVSTNSLITMPSVGAVDKIVDLNGDTWLDVVLRNGSGARYYLNSGCQLTLATQVLSNSYNGIAISDFNNDGKPDFFNAARDGQSCININDLNIQSYVAITAPVVSTQVNYFVGQSASPLVATGNNILWYTGSTGGTGTTTAPTPNTASVGSTSYWVSNTNTNGCESERIEVVVTVSLPATHLNFDGSNDAITVTGVNFPLGNTSRTIEAWIKTTQNNGGGAIMTYGNLTTNNRFALYQTGGKLNFVAENNDYNTNATINDGNWHHIAATHDGTSLKVYLDGVQVGTSQAKTFNTTGNQFSIGYRGVASEYFNGSIDEVRVWNVARTAEQINRSKNCELQGNETGLVAYYKFNQGIDQADNTAITTLNATTGSNGTLSNFSLTGTTSNWLAGSPVITGSVIPSNATATSPVTYNLGDTASALSATTGTNGTGLMWYTSATGGTGSTTAPTPSTTTAGSTSYWVASTNANGCESGRIEIIITVNANATHLNFDGANDIVNTGNGLTTYFTGKTAVTVEAWVRPETNSGLGVIAGNYDYPSLGRGLQMLLRRDNNGYSFWIDGGSGYSSVVASNTVILNTWQHVAGVWDGTTMKIYVDGTLISTTAKTGVIPLKTTAFVIGGNAQAVPEMFNGDIDEVRIWDIALNQTDIQNTMNCEAQAQPELVAYYKFNQGFDNANNAPITTLADELGNYNGTLTNFTLTGAMSNWAAGSPVTTGNTCATLSNSDFTNTNNSIMIYPNPSNGLLTINTPESIKVEAWDVLGKLILSSDLEAGSNKIDISNHAAGIYIFKATSANGESKIYKVIKE
ncbi:LamG-like jellyroll fold domain-containing protein [Flavobacterium channae]|uniref:LamG-like jellyroll fold domain-containing protein n=1 Tax=Flavobacterium channae TaxID=2897181 RepID=UPI001E2C42A5|nr:LamG-like jellyroll fold domain-containing protein [Flavobacterium channae]UGS23392.1 FG-GAP-like repeat-containing protein [Flavobacterium channae]